MATSIISAGDAANLGVQTTGGDDGVLVLRSGAAGAKVDALSIAAVGTGAFVGEVTATGFTGTLDGVLGGGTPAAANVTTLAVAGDVTGVTGINSGQIGGRRNILYNGEMKVAQRSASVAGLGAASGYFTLDRWKMFSSTAGRFTMAQIADGPAGFANSLKLTTTIADTSIAASEIIVLAQNIEGQDLQQIKKGTASAEQLTLSFWVKGNASATYVAELFDADNTRQISKSFSVTTSWAKITLLIPADTTGVLDDDNATSFGLNIWLHAGSNNTSGTLNSSAWAATVDANRAVGISSIVDTTSRTFFITGVQLELGATATEFESRTFGEELALCRRYYQKLVGNSYYGGFFAYTGSSSIFVQLAPSMRAAPTVPNYNVRNGSTGATASGAVASFLGVDGFNAPIDGAGGSATNFSHVNQSFLEADSEL